MRNALGYDLGALNAVVAFSFLNFSVIVFFVCVGLMIALSRRAEAASPGSLRGLTLEPSHAPLPRLPAGLTAAIGSAILLLWFHFR